MEMAHQRIAHLIWKGMQEQGHPEFGLIGENSWQSLKIQDKIQDNGPLDNLDHQILDSNLNKVRRNKQT